MKDISLKDLLEAGCHFGHRVDRWHPKAASFIYGEREGIHIIDLAKTKEGLKAACEFAKELGTNGKTLLLVATKRQARGLVAEAAKKAKIPYLTTRWIGGFLTNWDEVKKNIDKMNKLRQEKNDGSWNKFPKHEIIQLEKYLRKLEAVYSGVSELAARPETLFIVDVKKEIACLREGLRCELPIIAIVDTNADPTPVGYPIPANDDAIGSIRFITDYIVDAYLEGRKMKEKKEGKVQEQVEKTEAEKTEKVEMKKAEEVEKIEKVEKVEAQKTEKVETEKVEKTEPVKKKRGRPKKTEISKLKS
jgi:small subunit ribosomal protein S2